MVRGIKSEEEIRASRGRGGVGLEGRENIDVNGKRGNFIK